jgi:hypothetical protein
MNLQQYHLQSDPIHMSTAVQTKPSLFNEAQELSSPYNVFSEPMPQAM